MNGLEDAVFAAVLLDDPESKAMSPDGQPESSSVVDLAVIAQGVDRIRNHFVTQDPNYEEGLICFEDEWVCIKYAEQYGRRLAMEYLLDPVRNWYEKRIDELSYYIALTRFQSLSVKATFSCGII